MIKAHYWLQYIVQYMMSISNDTARNSMDIDGKNNNIDGHDI